MSLAMRLVAYVNFGLAGFYVRTHHVATLMHLTVAIALILFIHFEKQFKLMRRKYEQEYYDR